MRLAGAEGERLLPDRTCKTLVAYERWIAGGALKPFPGLSRPREKIPLMHQRTWNPLMHESRCIGILFYTYTVRMRFQKTPVPACGVQQAVGLLSRYPSDK